MKNKKFLGRFAIILGVCLFIAIAAVILLYMKMEQYRGKASEADYTLEQNKRYCLVTSIDIKAGDIISEDTNVMEQSVYTGLSDDYYISKEDLPIVATVDIASGIPVMKNMATKEEITTDKREYEISVANLMVTQAESDIVDVRIMFPNGEDFLVLAKKTIRSLDLENSIFYTTMTEEEMLRFASATIDAYTISGTKIYTTKYLEPALQEEAEPNYPVRTETMDLLNSDPNILSLAQKTLNLTARLDMENRLGELSTEQLTAVASGHSLQDTAQGSAITKKNLETLDDEEQTIMDGASEGAVFDASRVDDTETLQSNQTADTTSEETTAETLTTETPQE
mgnify:CR=1 FL=1